MRTLIMTTKSKKTLKLHHPLIQLLIKVRSNNPPAAKLPRMQSIIDKTRQESDPYHNWIRELLQCT